MVTSERKQRIPFPFKDTLVVRPCNYGLLSAIHLVQQPVISIFSLACCTHATDRDRDQQVRVEENYEI